MMIARVKQDIWHGFVFFALQLSILYDLISNRLNILRREASPHWNSMCCEHVLGIYLHSQIISRKCCNWHVSWALSVAWQLGNNAAVLTGRMTMRTITGIRLPFRNCRTQMQLLCINSWRQMTDEDKYDLLYHWRSRALLAG